MKRLISLILVLAVCFSLSACGAGANAAKREAALAGKKVLFVGCSYTYFGGTVCPAGEKTTGTNQEAFLREDRDHDNGFFYQICKANGLEVNVTDWTFGGHNLNYILGGERCMHNNRCRAGSKESHLHDLGDLSFDYVILNEINRAKHETAEDIRDSIEAYANLFKEANPDVKIYYIVHDGAHVSSSYVGAWLESVEMIEDLGITILDWGTMVWDVANGVTEVPGGTQPYRRNTFMVSRPDDVYHPNILSGYLYALMTYCAITGESAVGQPYDFCFNPESESYPISPRFELETHREHCYTYDNRNTEADERDSNFDAVFASPKDMKGLQKLVDQYLDDDLNAWKAYIH